MDFSNRNTQPQSTAPNMHAAFGSNSSNTGSGGSNNNNFKKNKPSSDKGKWSRIGLTILGAAIVILLIASIILLAFGGVKSEDKYVDTNKLQAVFLNTGQVYFGNIKSLNNKYFVLTNIFYLQTTNNKTSSSSSSSSNVTLVKLGCELHRPYDQMVINANQVTFWENLQSDGQVAKAVATFNKDNPNGQKCTDQSSSSGSTTNNVQSAPANSSSSSTTTKKP